MSTGHMGNPLYMFKCYKISQISKTGGGGGESASMKKNISGSSFNILGLPVTVYSIHV